MNEIPMIFAVNYLIRFVTYWNTELVHSNVYRGSPVNFVVISENSSGSWTSQTLSSACSFTVIVLYSPVSADANSPDAEKTLSSESNRGSLCLFKLTLPQFSSPPSILNWKTDVTQSTCILRSHFADGEQKSITTRVVIPCYLSLKADFLILNTQLKDHFVLYID